MIIIVGAEPRGGAPPKPRPRQTSRSRRRPPRSGWTLNKTNTTTNTIIIISNVHIISINTYVCMYIYIYIYIYTWSSGMWCFRMWCFKMPASEPLTHISFSCWGSSNHCFQTPHPQTPHPWTREHPKSPSVKKTWSLQWPHQCWPQSSLSDHSLINVQVQDLLFALFESDSRLCITSENPMRAARRIRS